MSIDDDDFVGDDDVDYGDVDYERVSSCTFRSFRKPPEASKKSLCLSRMSETER